MNWFFPTNNRGQEYGYHDPGVETFKGNFDKYLAREALQNAIDARFSTKKPVRVEISLMNICTEDLPGASELKGRMQACEAYWNDPKSKAFFGNAKKVLTGNTLPVLKISDFNTTGVTGGDRDKDGNWFNLVRSSGSSGKLGSEGGSFGIGKHAPFAASSLQTVFYSTLNADKETIFQGVARLVTHEIKGETFQNIGFCGDANGGSIRKQQNIPDYFRRDAQGTDILVCGYKGGKNWQRDMILAVLEDFWPAIHFGDLTVQIEDVEIKSKNLSDHLGRYCSDAESHAPFFYRALVETQQAVHFNRKLETIGEVDLWLLAGDDSFPNRIAFARKTGMIIFSRQFKSVLRYSGFFFCKNEQGNRRLREMEPPRHDEWNPDLPEKGASRAVFKEIIEWVRECIDSLSPQLTSDVLSLPDLYRYLPDDEEGSEDEPFENGQQTKGEQLNENSPKDEVIPVRPIKAKAVAPSGDIPGEDDDDEIIESDEEGGSKKRKRKEKAESDDGEEDVGSLLNLQFRSFLVDDETFTYRLTCHSPKARECTLVVRAVGDDAKAEPIALIRAASIDSRKTFPVKDANKVLGVRVVPNAPTSIDIQLASKLRCALEVNAYEI